MSQYFKVHPVDPQRRLLLRAVDIIRAGGIVVYPTDSSYAFGWNIGDKAALDKIRWIRQTQRDHDFTLVCRDLSDIATSAKVMIRGEDDKGQQTAAHFGRGFNSQRTLTITHRPLNFATCT